MLKASRLWGFAALCLLSGNGWVMARAWLSELGFPFAGCIHFALIGAVAGVVAAIPSGRDRPSGPKNGLRLAAIAAAGVCVFVLPAATMQLASGSVSESAAVAVFAAIPLMTVLYVSASGDGPAPRGLMVPSLIGLSGALLLFPVEPPRSVRGSLSLAAVGGCGVIAAVASVRMHWLLRGEGIARSVAAIGFAGAVLLGCYGAAIGWPAICARTVALEAARTLVFDLPLVWLATWLLREVNPVRLSARLLLAPLFTVVEGYVVVGAAGSFRDAVGVVLLLAGGWMVLSKDEVEELPTLSLH